LRELKSKSSAAVQLLFRFPAGGTRRMDESSFERACAAAYIGLAYRSEKRATTMHRVLLLAAVATAVLGAASANAAPRHKHHVRAARVVQTVPVQPQSYAVPLQRGPQVGPAWAGPNQCWTEEGYGRYAPCDGGGKSM
jgi:hypothetical protein